MAGEISKESKVSIGMAAAVLASTIGVVLWLTAQIGAVQEKIVPQVSALATNVQVMQRDIAGMREILKVQIDAIRENVGDRPTLASIQAVVAEMEGRIRTELNALERRVSALEKTR